MRIAVPIWEDRISPVLDTAARLLVVDTQKRKETSRFETVLDEQDIHRRCFRIKGLGVDIMVCGAVSRPLLRMLTALEIDIIPGISGNSEDVLTAYLEGNLHQARFLMPGFKRKQFGRGKGVSGGNGCLRRRGR